MSERGLAVLEAAMVRGDVRLVTQLLKDGIKVNTHFTSGTTPLNTAIANQEEEISMMLLKAGARYDLEDSFRFDGCRRLPIHYAAACDCGAVLRMLVDAGSSIDAPDEGRATPIHHAAASGNTDLVEWLVGQGCEVDKQSDSGRTALWKAAHGGHRETLHFLLAVGACVNIRHRVGTTVFFDCVRSPHLLQISADLIQHGMDVKARDIEGSTALHEASGSANPWAVTMLLEVGARAECANDHGNTPLHVASMHGCLASCVVLLNHSANPSRCNSQRQSPMFLAMLHLHESVVCLLHSIGSKLSSQELEDYRVSQAHRTHQRASMLKWYEVLSNSPGSLSCLCRKTVRQVLQSKPCHAVPHLPLPQGLRDLLLLADFSKPS